MWWWEALLVRFLRVDEDGREFLDFLLAGRGEAAAFGVFVVRHGRRKGN